MKSYYLLELFGKPSNGCERLIMFCTSLKSLAAAPLRLCFSPRSEQNSVRSRSFMPRRTTLLFLLLLASLTVQGQSSIVVQADQEVSKLLDAFVRVNTSETKVTGWRVQILATTDRQRLETVESSFKLNYPSIPVDWVHANPYYKLRAGAFQTKAEAERLKNTLSQQFDGVYLVKDQVTESELLRMY